MSAAAGAAAGVAAANYRIAAASAGAMVRLEPADFLRLVDQSENPVVVYANFRLIFTVWSHHYVMPYKGLTVVTRSAQPLLLPKAVELIQAKSMWLPI